MKKLIITIGLVLSFGLIYSQTSTINALTARTGTTGSDHFWIQTSGNVDYKLALDSIFVWGIKPLSDSVQLNQDSIRLLNDSIAQLHDSIAICVKYRDSLTTFATPHQVQDSLTQDYGSAYKTAERNITVNSTAEWYTVISSTAGYVNGTTFVDSIYTVSETGYYVVNYDISVKVDKVGELISRINSVDWGKKEVAIDAANVYFTISGSTIMELADGDTVKIQLNYDDATATITTSYFNYTIFKL